MLLIHFKKCSLLLFLAVISCKSQEIRKIMGSNVSPEPLPSSSEDGSPKKGSIVRTFNASEERQGQFVLNPKEGLISSQIEMKHTFEQESKIVRVPSPGLTIDLHQQGNPATTRSENFQQNELGIIDIQIVIDNSLSMQQEQSRIKNGLKDLLNYISASQWQIHITTTDPDKDPSKNCSRGLIRKGDANAFEAFQNALDAGVNGSSSERGVLMAVEGLKCFNDSWLRKNSTLAILIVSDEDNCSDGKDPECTNQPYLSTQYLLQYLSGTLGKQLGVDSRIYGIYWVPGTACADGHNQGFMYQDLVTQTKGQSGSICENDYAPVLQSISKDINSILKYEFLLKTTPKEGSVKVSITSNNNVIEINDFSVIGRTLRFNSPPPANSTINVQYIPAKILPVTDRFKLTKKPQIPSIKIMAEGKPVDPVEFSFDASTQEIVFKTLPNLDAEIRVEYWDETPPLTQINLETGILPSSTKISIDDKPFSNFQATESGLVNFLNPLGPGSLVVITYMKTTGHLTVYPLDIQSDDLKFVSASISGKSANIEIDSNKKTVKILDQDFNNGQFITVNFQTKTFGSSKINFPEKIVPDTYKIQSDTGSCMVSASIESADIQCNPEGESVMNVRWSYRTALQQNFTVDDVESPESGGWQVYVNAKEVSQFSRNGKTITILQPLSTSDVVEIRYHAKL